jgi:hypothetical protein
MLFKLQVEREFSPETKNGRLEIYCSENGLLNKNNNVFYFFPVEVKAYGLVNKTLPALFCLISFDAP